MLLNEAVDMLNVKKDGAYADLTLGGGGHSALILERGGRVVGIDRDMDAIRACRERFSAHGERFTAVHGNFSDIKEILERLGTGPLDGAVMDLGVSSHQLDVPERGFSYMRRAPLDMRMDQSAPLSAKEVVNTYDEKRLAGILSDYGEERWAKRIAEFIVKKRRQKPFEDTAELVDTVKAAVPKEARKGGPHPAKRTFQAIRIEVNRELDILSRSVEDAALSLKTGGRISVITFHSLEDRITKETFARLAKGCVCPPGFPVCVCGGKSEVRILTKKPVEPGADEIERNPRARSAKLRCAQRA